MSARHVLLAFLAIVGTSVVLLSVILMLVDETVRVELLQKAASTLLQLALIGILGAYAKFLLDQYSADRQRQLNESAANRQRQLDESARRRELRETKHQAQIEALNSLTTSYWQIKKAFHIIDAHRSAKSYGEQMRQIIDYRLELQRLNNEIEAGLYELDKADTITSNLSDMDDQLQKVIDEWKEHYLRLSQLQKHDEATDEPEKKKVPNEIGSLDVLGSIRKDKFKAIHGPFQRAVTPIREQLKRENSLPN